jgi:hypothetical protein
MTVQAGLAKLGRVDAVNSDPLASNLKRVTVNDPRRAGDVLGEGREGKQQEGSKG